MSCSKEEHVDVLVAFMLKVFLQLQFHQMSRAVQPALTSSITAFVHAAPPITRSSPYVTTKSYGFPELGFAERYNDPYVMTGVALCPVPSRTALILPCPQLARR